MACQRVMVHELGRLEFRGQPERATLASLNRSAPSGWEEYLSAVDASAHSPRRAGSEPPTRVRNHRSRQASDYVTRLLREQESITWTDLPRVTQGREDDERSRVQQEQERRRAEAEAEAERERQQQRQEEHDRERRRREEEAKAARQQAEQATTGDIFDMGVCYAQPSLCLSFVDSIIAATKY